MMSTPRIAIRLDSSWTVMTSGMTTSRAARACSAAPPRRFSFSRSRARRTEARDRMRSTAPSSSPATAWMVNRPSRRFGSPLVRETALPGPAPLRRSSSSSGRRSTMAPPGRGADRVARCTSGVAGGALATPAPGRGPRGAPGRGGAGRGASAEYRTVSPARGGRASPRGASDRGASERVGAGRRSSSGRGVRWLKLAASTRGVRWLKLPAAGRSGR